MLIDVRKLRTLCHPDRAANSIVRFPLLLAFVLGFSACNGGRDATAEVRDATANDALGPQTRYSMANGCYHVRDTSTNRWLAVKADGVVNFADSFAAATAFFMKPSDLGEYLFYDPDGRYLSLPAAADGLIDGLESLTRVAGWQVAGLGDTLLWLPPQLDPVGDGVDSIGDSLADTDLDTLGDLRGARVLSAVSRPDEHSRWTVHGTQDQFEVTAFATGISLVSTADSVAFEPAEGCTDFPEATLGASGTPFSGTNPDGTVFGYAETHMHLGGSSALGGRLGYGAPFHPLGISEALDNCAVHHGPQGALDVLDTVVNAQRSAPPHATEGWPSFAEWPQWGSQTHHQTYWVWLQRAWMGGLRLMVNHFVANEEICQLWPYQQHDCNEMESVALQRELVLDLQDYIDAQMGGPGQGFFRIVYSSSEARQVIEDGKLAVILGTENEKIFDCGEYLDQPLCTREHYQRELDRWYDLGIRSIFPIHLLDNAFGGTRLSDDPALSVLYQTANVVATGHPFATVSCDTIEDYPQPGSSQTDPPRGVFDAIVLSVLGPPPVPPVTGCQRNARGLTEMGEDFVHALIDHGIMIETDHSGVVARRRIFDIAQQRGVPVFSGHTGEIGPVKDSRRILEVGGIISNLTDEPADETIAFVQALEALWLELNDTTYGLATGHGSDINGIHNQPPPHPDAASDPLSYPFRSYDGRVIFEKQVSGDRVFDLNVDGVAHYGLYPDYFADIQRRPGGEDVMKYLFRSAEAYLQRWEQVENARVVGR